MYQIENVHLRNHIYIYFFFFFIVFKILKIFPDQIQNYLDLRDLPGKQLNLNFSNNDVQWNPRDGNFVVSHNPSNL